MDHVVDPLRSVLVAQVRKAEASHCMDTASGLLRGRHFQGPKATVYLGDVGQAFLTHLPHPETPMFTEPPGYNEQRWTLTTQSGDLRVEIASVPYWGWGLVTSGYLNIVTLEGPLQERSRLVFDVVSSLGQPPWEMAHSRAADRFMSRRAETNAKRNEAEWRALRSDAKTTLSEHIQRFALRGEQKTALAKDDEAVQGWVDAVNDDLHMARQALAEDNAPGVERALARIEASLIHLEASGESALHEPADRFTVEGLVVDETHTLLLTDASTVAMLTSEEEVPFVDLTAGAVEEE